MDGKCDVGCCGELLMVNDKNGACLRHKGKVNGREPVGMGYWGTGVVDIWAWGAE